MKPPRPTKAIGRKRRVLGWTLLTLGVSVAAVWFISRWWAFGYGFTTRMVFFIEGTVAFASFENESTLDDDRGWDASPTEDGGVPGRWVWAAQDEPQTGRPFDHASLWLVWRDTYGGYGRYFYAVLWPVPLLLGAVGTPVLRSGITARRRALTGACTKCGYNLAGLAPDAPCPECGKSKA